MKQGQFTPSKPQQPAATHSAQHAPHARLGVLQVELHTELNETPTHATTITAAHGIVFHGDTFLATDFTRYGTWAETVCGDLHQVRLEMIDSSAPGTFAICLFY